MTGSAIYSGTVFHRRFAPRDHRLSYRVFQVLLDLDELEQVQKLSWAFSINRPGLFSFHESDHGNPEESRAAPLKDRIIDLVAPEGVNRETIDRVLILTCPRVLGYAFNPLTVYWCLGGGGEARAIVYEVRNTFGERHNYIFPCEGHGDAPGEHVADKRFHVSPFFDREGTYQFRLSGPDERVGVVIDYSHESQRRMTASFQARKLPITTAGLAKLFLQIPLMTVKITLGILWEALILWLKGLKVYSHPEDHPWQASRAHPVAAAGEQLPQKTTDKSLNEEAA